MSLLNKGILVRVVVHKFPFEERDHIAEEMFASTFGVNQKAIKMKKETLLKEYTAALDKSTNAIRPFVCKFTLPWRDGGWRLLNISLIDIFETGLKIIRDEQVTALDSLESKYQDLTLSMKTSLGILGNVKYPEFDEVRNSFGFDIKYEPIATSGDLRVEAEAELKEKLVKEVEDYHNEKTNLAMQDVLNRIVDSISHMKTRLDEYTKLKEVGDKSPRLHKTIVENVRELVQILPFLNITDDPKIEMLRQQMESELAGFDIETLKENKNEREDAIKKADDILNNISGLFS